MSMITHLQALKSEHELCICGHWRRAGQDEVLTSPPPPQIHATPWSCPDCRKRLNPVITVCQHCSEAWQWYGGPLWYYEGRPTIEQCFASHGICPRCKDKVRPWL